MVVIAAAAIAISAPSPARLVKPSIQAIATIRVISGVRLSFGAELSDPDVPRARNTLVKTGGAQQPARLIEFQ